MFSKKTEEILKIGKSLFDIGINNWALTKSDSIFAIERFYSLEVPILGGDVYEIINGVLQSNYDNWYCDPLPGETRKDFVNRSINKARNYIETYKGQGLNNNYFFVLVPDS
jgi:hypothetical protein